MNKSFIQIFLKKQSASVKLYLVYSYYHFESPTVSLRLFRNLRPFFFFNIAHIRFIKILT